MRNFRQNISLLISGVLHVLFFGAMLLLQEKAPQIQPIELDMAPEQVAENALPISDTQGDSSGDFSGQSLSQPAPQPVVAQEKAKPAGIPQGESKESKQFKKLSAGLSGLAAQMAKMNISGLKTTVGKPGQILGGDGGKISALAKGVSVGNGSGLGGQFQVVGSGNIGGQMKWNLMTEKEKHSFTAKDQEVLAETIRSLQDDFRSCYENALLVDENLSVTLQMEVDILNSDRVGQPKYRISGRSSPEGEQHLSSCMTKVLQKVKFNERLRGVKFKNEIIFKS